MSERFVTNPVLLTVADLAKLLNTSQRSIYRFHASGKLPRPLRLGQQPRWVRAEIEAWIAAGMPSRAHWNKVREAAPCIE
jgi:excisionase family DNA binding protein